MRVRRRTIPALLVSLLVIMATLPPPTSLTARSPQAAQSAQIDYSKTYRLTNDYAGGRKSLSVSGTNNAVVMADTNLSANQVWKLFPAARGKYRLTNQAAGGSLSLDNSRSGDQYSVVMGTTGSYSGQFWTLTPLEGGKFRLTNDFGKSLDNGKSGDQYSVVMADQGNYSGQFWTLTMVVSLTTTTVIPDSRPTPTPTPINNQPATGYVPGFPTGKFMPGEVANGKLLCPIIGPGPQLIKGCIIGRDPAWASRTSGPATYRGAANSGECAAYGRVAGLGYAFHDPRNRGECWSCPVLTARTMHPVDSKNPSFPACSAGNDDGIVWQSAQYPEPGVAAFINPEIVQLAFNDVAYVDAFLNKRVQSRFGTTKQMLWDQMIQRPNDSPEFKALIFSAILLVAQKDPNYRIQPSQAVLIFEDYIRKRRTYLAQDASAMYDAYLGFNAYKQNQGTKAVIAAGGPLMIQGLAKAVISAPGASLSATLGVPPDDYVNAAYSGAVPDSRGEEFIGALADLGATPYQHPSSGTASFDPTTVITLELNKIGSATAIHDLLESYKIIKGIRVLQGRSGLGIGLGMGLAGNVLDAVAAVMTVFAQEEADKQYRELVNLADRPVSIAQILQSGSDEERNSLIMWWALATSPYRASGAAREFPIQTAAVCAKYPSQCADVQRIGAKVRTASPQVQPVRMAPAPREFLEQVNATAALARLLSTVNSTVTANAVKPSIADAVQRFNKAELAAKNLSGAAREAADQHKSELDAAYAQLRRELARVRGVPGVYPILQGTLAQIDPAALRRLTLDP